MSQAISEVTHASHTFPDMHKHEKQKPHEPEEENKDQGVMPQGWDAEEPILEPHIPSKYTHIDTSD